MGRQQAQFWQGASYLVLSVLWKQIGKRVTANLPLQGVVVFFPSFHYADEAVASWKTSGLWASMQKKKKVFSEPKTANMVESTLSKYHSCIEESTEYEQGRTQDGALLLCVVGGKLAEGINFGDGLGRYNFVNSAASCILHLLKSRCLQ